MIRDCHPATMAFLSQIRGFLLFPVKNQYGCDRPVLIGWCLIFYHHWEFYLLLCHFSWVPIE